MTSEDIKHQLIIISCLLYVRVSWAVSKQGWWTGKDEVVATCGLRESLVTKAMPPPFALDPPAERGKERTEHPGGARSAILASSPAGRSQVSISSMMSMLFSWMKVDMSDLLLEVPTDLALNRQTRSVFSAEEELKGMWSSCLWGGRSRVLSEEAERSSCSGGQGRHRWQTTLSSLCCVAHGCCDAQLQWTCCHWTQAQHDRLAASSVKQRGESGLAETEQDQLSSLPVEVTHKTGTTITATSRGTMLSRQLIRPGD